MLNEKYPKIYWSPCSAHCINLILQDIGEMTMISTCVNLGAKISSFVYNNKFPHGWLKARPGWTEIVRPAATRFGTNFIALKSLYEHRADLEALVLCPEYRVSCNNERGRKVRECVLNSRFWSNCNVIVKLMEPLMKLLRICDTDVKPSIGYVYETLERAIRATKELFKGNQEKYKPFVDSIQGRFDNMLRLDLHGAAYWLNPTFQYDPDHSIPNAAFLGFLKVVQDYYADVPNIVEEITMFREGVNSFGSPLAKNALKNKSTSPDEWWKIFGVSAPYLQKLAMRILSQTSSSSDCERNWSVFDRIHTKKRNRLEHQRLNDLVFVHYNLRLQNRGKDHMKMFDPLEYECIDMVDSWIVDDEECENACRTSKAHGN
ncbi:hypothetical protein OROGR_004660 [Orobanche gracilis]